MKLPYKVEEALNRLAAVALQWLMCAERPLYPDEWISGMSWATVHTEPDFTPDMSVLLDICYNIVVRDNQGLMRFAHLSVREYLEQKFSNPKPHIMAANACLSFLTHALHLPITPFGEYAVDHWPFHSQKCSGQASELLEAFLGTSSCPGPSYVAWLRAAPIDNRFKFTNILSHLRCKPPNPLLAAAYFGFAHCAGIWKPGTFNVNFTSYLTNESLLSLAYKKGNLEVIDILLARDAKITEVVVAGAAGNSGNGMAVMELLLARDTKINITEAVVTAAIGNGDNEMAMLKLLLSRDARINITEAALIAAAGNWDNGTAVIKLLLDTAQHQDYQSSCYSSSG